MVHAHDLSEPWQAQRRGPRWFVLLLGVVVFALFGAVVGYAYLRGLPGMGSEPPLIRAAAGPYRVAPADRGGIVVPNAKSSIVTVLRPQTEPPRVERLLPVEPTTPLEAPEPEVAENPLVAAPAAPAADTTGVSDPTAAPDAAERLAAPEADTEAVPSQPYPRSRPAAPEPVAEAEPVAETVAALSTVEPPVPPPPAPVVATPVVPEPPAAASPPRSVQPQPVAPPAAAPPPPAAQAQPPAATAPTPPPAATNAPQRLVRTAPAGTASPTALASIRPAAGAGVYRLQLAAVRSEGGLTQAWADLRQRYAAALGGVNPQVERTDTTSGPLFRLQAGPFGSREAAADACSMIRGSGGQCFIVGPVAQ